MNRLFLVTFSIFFSLIGVSLILNTSDQADARSSHHQASTQPAVVSAVLNRADYPTYIHRSETFNGIKTATLALFGPDQRTSFGDPFSPTDSVFRDQYQHDGIYTFRIDIPADYKGIVTPDGSDRPFETEILRVELLDPDSINRLVPEGSTITFTQTVLDILNQSGIEPDTQISNNSDCILRQIYQPCVIRTCEWYESNCSRALNDESYTQQLRDLPLSQINPHWVMRFDKLRRPGGTTSNSIYETPLEFTLYYYQNDDTGSAQRVDLASYISQSEHITNVVPFGGTPIGDYHTLTDLNWVSPGAWNEIGPVPTRCQDQNLPGNNGGFDIVDGGEDFCLITTPGDEDELVLAAGDIGRLGRGFEINVEQDIPGIVVDEQTQTRSLYLDVRSVAGASENGFHIWAGPPHAHFGLSSDANLRNVQIVNEKERFSTQGVTVFALGSLPENSLTNTRIELTLAYIPPTYAGQEILVSLFDADSGVNYPICFYFDTLPQPDCRTPLQEPAEGYRVYYDEANDHLSNGIPFKDRCFPRCNNQFVTPAFEVPVPMLSDDCDPEAPFEERMQTCNSFTGGNLVVSYDGGQHDSLQWLMSTSPNPILSVFGTYLPFLAQTE